MGIVRLLQALRITKPGEYEILFNEMYNNGSFPANWLESIFITILKIFNDKKCNDYRLMSHILKLYLKISDNRIYK